MFIEKINPKDLTQKMIIDNHWISLLTFSWVKNYQYFFKKKYLHMYHKFFYVIEYIQMYFHIPTIIESYIYIYIYIYIYFLNKIILICLLLFFL